MLTLHTRSKEGTWLFSTRALSLPGSKADGFVARAVE